MKWILLAFFLPSLALGQTISVDSLESKGYEVEIKKPGRKPKTVTLRVVKRDTVFVYVRDTVWRASDALREENQVLRSALVNTEARLYHYRDVMLGFASRCDTLTLKPFTLTLKDDRKPLRPYAVLGLRAEPHREAVWHIGAGLQVNMDRFGIECAALFERQRDSTLKVTYPTIISGGFRYYFY